MNLLFGSGITFTFRLLDSLIFSNFIGLFGAFNTFDSSSGLHFVRLLLGLLFFLLLFSELFLNGKEQLIKLSISMVDLLF